MGPIGRGGPVRFVPGGARRGEQFYLLGPYFGDVVHHLVLVLVLAGAQLALDVEAVAAVHVALDDVGQPREAYGDVVVLGASGHVAPVACAEGSLVGGQRQAGRLSPALEAGDAGLLAYVAQQDDFVHAHGVVWLGWFGLVIGWLGRMGQMGPMGPVGLMSNRPLLIGLIRPIGLIGPIKVGFFEVGSEPVGRGAAGQRLAYVAAAEGFAPPAGEGAVVAGSAAHVGPPPLEAVHAPADVEQLPPREALPPQGAPLDYGRGLFLHNLYFYFGSNLGMGIQNFIHESS